MPAVSHMGPVRTTGWLAEWRRRRADADSVTHYNRSKVSIESALKANLRVLAEQAARRVIEAGLALEYFRGASVYFDERLDDLVTGLPAFESACLTLGSIPMVRERYGVEPAWKRLVLQFAFGFLGDLPRTAFEASVFEATWEAFWGELLEPEWTWIALANLTNFRSESDVIDVCDGVSIRGRSFEDLARMGWTEGHLQQLSQEWFEEVAMSSHVILAKHMMTKTPENFLSNELVTLGKVRRALLALRLFKDGDVGLGRRIWHLRAESFDFGRGPSSITFQPGVPTMGGVSYTLEESEVEGLRELYGELRRYNDSAVNPPVNLDLAISFFSDAYDRHTFGREDTRLVDTITAAEALLGTKSKIKYRLSFRVASLLADDDEQTVLFAQIKLYYNARSTVVHGDELTSAEQARLGDQAALRNAVRRLIVGFVRLANSPENPSSGKTFRDQLDRTLRHAKKRSALRAAMGLE